VYCSGVRIIETSLRYWLDVKCGYELRGSLAAKLWSLCYFKPLYDFAALHGDFGLILEHVTQRYSDVVFSGHE
jgi:hypothetical protein